MRSTVLVFLIFSSIRVFSQHQQPDAASIKLNLKKLNVLGSVLYVAAHPDDENTRIITSMANDRLMATAYLSMTRGDGGQNLIGPEIRDLLGLIRTQELLAARRIDGGQQYFTRANDFGFSKSADETFQIWNKDEILKDVVYVFREYQPDVIITRFPPDERAGHGHHTASAILAQEAFDLANDASRYPDQVKKFGTWQVKRLYTNTGRWWNNTINENTPGITTLDVGGYSSLLGTSFSEIAATSRSQHKSQGFGSRGTRGYQPEFLEFVKGDKGEKDIFDGVNTTWSRVKGGTKIQPLVDRALKEFNTENPAASVSVLFQIRAEIAALEPGVWRTRKLKEVEQLIQDCLGLFIEVTANQYWVAPGEKVVANVELVNRSAADVIVKQMKSRELGMDSTMNLSLKSNAMVSFKDEHVLHKQTYSDPYWLREPHSTGLFTVSDASMIGKPENNPAVPVTFTISVGGQSFDVQCPVVYKWTDPVKGERSRPFEVVPPVFVNLSDKILIFNSEKPREVNVTLKSSVEGAVKGEVQLDVPTGWKVEPASMAFDFSKRNEEVVKHFLVYPSQQEQTSTIKAKVVIAGKGTYDLSVQTIAYDHIPTQTLLPKAEAKVVRLNLKKEGDVIGYIKGAGDDVPDALRNMGYEVWEMKNEEVTAENLKRVDAVVLGIRAVNTNERIGFIMPNLLEYVKNGGTMVVQYNTSGDLETDKFAPYPLTISRDRVTDEQAEVRILKPDHPLLNTPNKIAANDFDGWVQERGLYYPNKWDPQYESLLSMNDKGETPKDGSLLVAKYGEGYYVYTGLSFFRELPEGVAGAYKLFANLVSIGKSKKPENGKVKSKAKIK